MGVCEVDKVMIVASIWLKHRPLYQYFKATMVTLDSTKQAI